jgi:hypothetical protein
LACTPQEILQVASADESGGLVGLQEFKARKLNPNICFFETN